MCNAAAAAMVHVTNNPKCSRRLTKLGHSQSKPGGRRFKSDDYHPFRHMPQTQVQHNTAVRKRLRRSRPPQITTNDRRPHHLKT